MDPIEVAVSVLSETTVTETYRYEADDFRSHDYRGFTSPWGEDRLRAFTRGASVKFAGQPAQTVDAGHFRAFVTDHGGVVPLDAFTPLGPVRRIPPNEHLRSGLGNYASDGGAAASSPFVAGGHRYAMAVPHRDCKDPCPAYETWRAVGSATNTTPPEIISPDLRGCEIVLRFLVCDAVPKTKGFRIREFVGNYTNDYVVFETRLLPSVREPLECIGRRLAVPSRDLIGYGDITSVTLNECLDHILTFGDEIVE